MKKTIIALFALAGVAAADSLFPDLLQTEGETTTTTMNWLGNTNPAKDFLDNAPGLTGKNVSLLTEEKVAKVFASASDLTAAGWHATTAQMGHNNTYSVSTTDSTKDVYVSANNAFKFTGRNAYEGEFVACSVAASGLLQDSPESVVTSITLEFDVTPASGGVTFSLWAWNGTTATSLLKGATVNNATLGKSDVYHKFTATAEDNTIKVSNLSLGTNDTIIAVWGNSSGGGSNIIAGLTSSYSISTVPEPTTATLSLLALAGLAARRRRK